MIPRNKNLKQNSVEYDNNKTEAFKELNLCVIRFSNYEVDNNFKDVCQKIDSKIAELMN